MKVSRPSAVVTVPPAKPIVTPAKPVTRTTPVGAPVLNAPELSSPVTGASSLGWNASGFWLDQAMLKPPFQTNLPLDDVFDGPLPVGVELPQLLPTDDRRAVYDKLVNIPLERMLVSPGYRYYRHPSAFADVFAQVQAKHIVDTKPSIIDVHTDGQGHVLTADLRSHHLRMAAFIEAGAKKLGDLPFDQVLIKVDGMQREDHYWPMKAHGYALPSEILAREGVHVVDGDDPATVEIANLPNWQLGSRTSLKQFHDTLLHREQPKVGVIYGAGADLVDRALALRSQRGLDEVVIAPSGPVDEALLARVRQTDGVNLYLDQPLSLRSTFPDIDYEKLVKYRLNLIYGIDIDRIVS